MTTEGNLRASRAVLDTNTILDWFVFVDVRVRPLAQAVETGHLEWVACTAMREELGRMLVHPSLARWAPDAAGVLASFDRHTNMHPAPPPAPLILRCSDPDDQVFMDLAVITGARWLLTHDRALLKLARRALKAGVEIVTPGSWCNSHQVRGDN